MPGHYVKDPSNTTSKKFLIKPVADVKAEGSEAFHFKILHAHED
jgi:hypothetical protein